MQTADISSFFHHLFEIATRETLPYFRKANVIDNKLNEGFDPVTEADRNTELALRKAIMDHWPEHGITGEEFDQHQEDAEYRWIIDPIDGTRAFITGLPLWGTLVALYHRDEPIAGMMAQPFTGELFISAGGISTFSRNGTLEKISTSSVGSIGEAALMSTSLDMFTSEERDRFDQLSNQCKLVRFGGDCYAYCMLASGQVDLVCEANLKLFDVAALIPIIEGAGGVVTDWEGNRNPPGGQVLAAANETLHVQALTALQERNLQRTA